MRYVLRPMLTSDIDAVIEGEEKVFGKSLGKDFLLSELEINPYSQYLVLEINKKVRGYVGLWINDNMEIVNLYVDEKYQGMGFGSMIMEFIISLCEDCEIACLSLEVRESNEKAIALYEKFGLSVKAKRKAYYDDGEDALLMVREFEVEE